ncbi:hypothetical protein JRQ81_012263 [Phrynocephalus forsythii]|uniref:Uncharacterized protein n=1 Tax=Phrynocephalus forsythii TaxID=171643 RepID=A0A9Q0X5I6_9SAUR|nr:hypothetical protein JRQ81_012263 [Phrynocephalus forsythii]
MQFFGLRSLATIPEMCRQRFLSKAYVFGTLNRLQTPECQSFIFIFIYLFGRVCRQKVTRGSPGPGKRQDGPLRWLQRRLTVKGGREVKTRLQLDPRRANGPDTFIRYLLDCQLIHLILIHLPFPF